MHGASESDRPRARASGVRSAGEGDRPPARAGEGDRPPARAGEGDRPPARASRARSAGGSGDVMSVVLGATLGWFAGSLLRIRRAQVESAIARAGIARARDVARAMYRRLGVALIELLRARTFVEVDTDALDAALARGPVVIFASHCENWELAAAGAARHLADRGRALYVVAKPMRSAFFDRWLSRLRERLGLRVIAPMGALASAASALARGAVVAMPIDQVPDREAHGLWLDFLGAPALVDRAPATVAHRARATVLVVAGGRVLDLILPPTNGDRSTTWIAATTRRATAALERHIRADPASWMWLHRRWKRPRLVASPRPE